MSLKELAREIEEKCQVEGIIYDDTSLPIKFGPDCYIFHGTPQSEECSNMVTVECCLIMLTLVR